MMANGDRERRIFLSHPHKNNGFFTCSSLLNIAFYVFKKEPKEVPEYAEMRHVMKASL